MGETNGKARPCRDVVGHLQDAYGVGEQRACHAIEFHCSS
jgi:hypothetical protein